METGNKFVLLLIVCLSSHLLYTADADNLEPSSPSPTPSPSPSPSSSIAQQPTSSNPSPAPAPSTSIPSSSISIPVSEIPDSPDQDSILTSTPTTDDPTPAQAIPSLSLAQPNPFVKQLCDSTDNPLLCITSTVPFLHGNFDLTAILQGEIKACQNHTQMVIDKALEISEDPSTNPDITEGLDYCKENYDSVISNLEEAINAVASHDVGTLNSMLSAVITDVGTCQDTFAEVTTSPSPVADMDDMLMKLASNCLAILSALRW